MRCGTSEQVIRPKGGQCGAQNPAWLKAEVSGEFVIRN
jgi:hypothetical protein